MGVNSGRSERVFRVCRRAGHCYNLNEKVIGSIPIGGSNKRPGQTPCRGGWLGLSNVPDEPIDEPTVPSQQSHRNRFGSPISAHACGRLSTFVDLVWVVTAVTLSSKMRRSSTRFRCPVSSESPGANKSHHVDVRPERVVSLTTQLHRRQLESVAPSGLSYDRQLPAQTSLLSSYGLPVKQCRTLFQLLWVGATPGLGASPFEFRGCGEFARKFG